MRKILFSSIFLLVLSTTVYSMDVDFAKKHGGTSCQNVIATDYVGDKTDYSPETTAQNANTLYCTLYTPSQTCTNAVLTTAAIKEYVAVGTVGTKLYVYKDDGGGTPTAGDKLVWQSTAMVVPTGAAAWVESTAGTDKFISSAFNYFVCTVHNNTVTVTRTASGTRTLYYLVSTNSYTTAPINLGGTWSTSASRDFSMYVKVK